MNKTFTLFIMLLVLQACADVSSTSQTEQDDLATSNTLCISADQVLVPAPVKAFVATTAPDYSSGAHSVISGDVSDGFTALNNLLPTGSDLTIAAYDDAFYRIERAFSGNNITKFMNADPAISVWQYSVNDNGSAVAADPHDMVFVSDTKAYVLRYGATKAWIVNPSATNAADFKIGELDFSQYGGTDGVPDMDSAVLVGDKLFVILQRLEGPTFQVVNDAYVAIIDVNTDQEIDANIPGDSLKGIPLNVRNPTKIVYQPDAHAIYVMGSGSFFPVKYVGGIEKINPDSYATTVILDDGDDAHHPYGLITEMALASDSVLYFVGYESVNDNTLYVLDMTNNTVLQTMVTALIDSQIADLAIDRNGYLWVADSADATVRIIDTFNCEQVDAISTNINPARIAFDSP